MKAAPASAAAVRAFALDLPAAEERDHMGSASFRVAGKIFAQLVDGETVALVKMSLDEQAERVADEPNRFWVPAHWAKFGWTYVRIAGTNASELRMLLESSWKRVAPKALVGRFRASSR
jgi:hypothetical protein